jgi:UDP:flavonoid glycosyltransferase YjiC (YdhE family)
MRSTREEPGRARVCFSMRVLFATTDGAGHFGPLVPFAHACQRAGHDVLVVGQAGAAPLAQRARLSFRTVPEPAPEDVARCGAGQRSLSAGAAMARAFTDLYVGLYGKAALPGMLAAIEKWRPDVVVRESAEMSSMVAADRLGLPHAQVGIGLSTRLADRLLPLAVPRLDELRAMVGLAEDPGALSARSLVLTMAPPALDDPSAPQSSSVLRFRDRSLGPAESWQGPLAGQDQPLIYLSFGTEVPSPTRSYFPGVYRDALNALAGLGVRVLVAIGNRRDPAELGPLPASVRVERWVPQAAVMHAAAATVGHGGSGSVLSALAAGVPMALVPMFADQPFNARLVAGLGAGLMLDDGPASMPALEPAVRELLDDARFRDRAQRIADEMRALPPVDDAVDALSALAAGRRAA